MLLAFFVSAVLVAACFLIHFAVMRRLAGMVHRRHSVTRRPMLFVIFILFAVHLAEVMLYACTLALADWAGVGELAGTIGSGAEWYVDHFYFSIASYTTLGIGDIVPHGAIRIIAGIESLNGLVLITWSASFTYLMMERVWGNAGEHTASHH